MTSLERDDMSLIKVQDVAYVRFGAPDLAKMRAFLLDFGLIHAEEVGDSVLRMRGLGVTLPSSTRRFKAIRDSAPLG